MRKKEKCNTNGSFGSSLGFILACVGSAVGLGNIWMFPYRLGEYGGAAFLLPYLFFIVLFGWVGLAAEFAIGRRARTGTLGAYAYCFAKKGVKGFLKSFAEPIPLMLPMNILEIFIRPLSLCMRLFGNILGAFVIMELIKIVAPLLVPVPLSLYFDLFDGFIQAYVFVFLTSLFIKETIE